MVGTRRGTPLAVGYGDGAMYLASDAFAMAPLTNRLAYLEDGDLGGADTYVGRDPFCRR